MVATVKANDIYNAFNFKNTQPLLKEENLVKSDKSLTLEEVQNIIKNRSSNEKMQSDKIAI